MSIYKDYYEQNHKPNDELFFVKEENVWKRQ